MSTQPFDEKYRSKPPNNYEQFFVPSIGKPLAVDLVDLANIQIGEDVLDVACGTGIVARLVAQKTGNDGAVAGLDVNAGMLAVAKSVTPDSSIDWYEGSAEAMPFPDRSFDVVICQMGLQFMPEKKVALQEMKRVLKPCGRILLNVPGPASGVFSIFAEELKKHISSEAAGFINHVFSLHDVDEIQELFEKTGFQKIDISVTTKVLQLPKPKEFLWQYIFSTPLAHVISDANEGSCMALEKEVVDKWKLFVRNGQINHNQRIVKIKAYA